VERRNAQRDPILVDIDITHPGNGYCHGYVKNISRSGVSVTIREGHVPACQHAVMLGFRIWTGNETLYRRIYCRIVRREEGCLALEFAENDIVTDAIIQDLMFYQQRADRLELSKPVTEEVTLDLAPEASGC